MTTIFNKTKYVFDTSRLRLKTLKKQKKLTNQEKKTRKLKRDYNKKLNGKWIGRRAFFSIYKEYLKSQRWMFLRSIVLARSDGFCENCFKKSKCFHVHHLNYKTWGRENPEDLLALCLSCHSEIHGRRL